MTQPEFIGATQQQIDAILALAKPTFPEPEYELLRKILETFSYVMRSLQNARTTITRFRRMLFGASTESAGNLLKGVGRESQAKKDTPSTESESPDTSPGERDEKKTKPRIGHGRNGAEKYSNSPVVHLCVTNLKSGDSCPECLYGKVYESPPKTIVKVIGQPPLTATIYKLEHLRCRLCDATFTARLPEGTSAEKYDTSCATMLAILRYGSGMPFYRLEGLQASMNIPLPDSTQWDIVSKAVEAPQAVFTELTNQAAQGDVVHNDDTRAKILSIIVARKKAEAAGLTPEAKAINTSGIISILPQGQKVALFFTGHPHAGDNLSQVLKQRDKDLVAPIQMSDALSSNYSKEFATILANCLSHGRRMFVDVMEHFPEPCAYVIETLGKVYAFDAKTLELKMSSEQRLQYHRTHSAKPMEELKQWMQARLDQREVEPISGLGKAFGYMLRHWEELTLFLRKAGAPLDNNICERALKRAIRHRKNSMFYWTPNGAKVGDIYMSLIHTCELCKVNPFDYLQALHSHAKEVMAKASLWLPWNYRAQLPVAP